MKLAPGYEYKLDLVLDFRVALEAVLVQRLRQQPITSQQEWLRRLLVLGFREECQCLQQTTEPVRCRTSGVGFDHRLTQETRESEPAHESPAQKFQNTGPTDAKPLAALQKVLGEKAA
ncbi:MAG: hypothetical protein AB8B81_01105 [Halioglobus sp.]